MTIKQLPINMPEYVAEKLERLANAKYRKNRTAAVLDLIMKAAEPTPPIAITYKETVEAKYLNIDEIVQNELAKYTQEHCRIGGVPKEATVWVERVEVQGGSPILMFSARWESTTDWHTSHRWCLFDQPSHA